MVVGSCASLPPACGDPPHAMVVALAALFVALGGPAQAAKLIDGKKIKKNSITSKQVKRRHAEAARPLQRGAAAC